ncbi:MAG TPA: hypothetical protein PL064_07735 [Thermogutta sp.]|nr:hypothetical protein [Thermogutta sp.]
MTYEQPSNELFQLVAQREFSNIMELFSRKNKSYGRNADLFHNFRETARRIEGNTDRGAMFKVLATYVDKHWVALCNRGLDDPECEERLRDIIVYCLLALCLMEDGEVQQGTLF